MCIGRDLTRGRDPRFRERLRHPVHKICGCRSFFRVPLSITPLVPFPYLRLRKKLVSSYSAFRPKWTGNRNFWTEHAPQEGPRTPRQAPEHVPHGDSCQATATPTASHTRSGLATVTPTASPTTSTQLRPPLPPNANGREPPCFKSAKPPLPCSFGSDSYKTQRISPRKTVCVGQRRPQSVGQGSPGERGPRPADSLGK